MTMDIHQHSLRVDTSSINSQKAIEQFHQKMSPRSPRSPSSGSPKLNSYPSPSSSSFLLEKPKIKRSFDVAFLIQPDDLSKKRQQKIKQNAHLSVHLNQMPVQEPMNKVNILPVNDAHLSNLLLQNSYLYDQRNLNYLSKLEEQSPAYNLVVSEKSPYNLESLNVVGSKSAFTKVAQPPSRQEKLEDRPFTSPPTSPSISSQISGGGGMSPDNSYQGSLSPPGIVRTPEPFVRQKLPVEFSQSSIPSSSLPFFSSEKPGGNVYEFNTSSHREKPVERAPKTFYNDPKSAMIHVSVNEASNSATDEKPPTPIKNFPSPKSLRLGGNETVPYPSEAFSYPGLSVPNYPFPQMTPFPRQTVSMPLLAAATANVALLPTSLAALTLPAQNVCAKCKVSFRMTSDLVYHMRSHHKRESSVNDNLRKRREEKLKCPVCNESFRERHHLTRHMTAHQDKVGDRIDLEDQEISEITSRANKKQNEKVAMTGTQVLPNK